jgi:integrase
MKHITWHDLRRTFGMWAIKGWHSWQGGKAWNRDQIGKFLGHLNSKSTEIYAQLDSSDLHSFMQTDLLSDLEEE